jgi:hypothetical protein
MGSTSYVPRTFPHRRIPDQRSFSAFSARLGRNGTFDVQPNGRCRPQIVVTSQGEVTVFGVVFGDPDTSKRRVVTRQGVLQNTVSLESCTLSFSTISGITASVRLPVKKNTCCFSENAFVIMYFRVSFDRILKPWSDQFPQSAFLEKLKIGIESCSLSTGD